MVYSNYGNNGMARDHRYKVVVRNEGKGSNELYDLVADPAENVNQYDNGQFVTSRDELAAELAGWKKKYSS